MAKLFSFFKKKKKGKKPQMLKSADTPPPKRSSLRSSHSSGGVGTIGVHHATNPQPTGGCGCACCAHCGNHVRTNEDRRNAHNVASSSAPRVSFQSGANVRVPTPRVSFQSVDNAPRNNVPRNNTHSTAPPATRHSTQSVHRGGRGGIGNMNDGVEPAGSYVGGGGGGGGGDGGGYVMNGALDDDDDDDDDSNSVASKDTIDRVYEAAPPRLYPACESVADKMKYGLLRKLAPKMMEKRDRKMKVKNAGREIFMRKIMHHDAFLQSVVTLENRGQVVMKKLTRYTSTSHAGNAFANAPLADGSVRASTSSPANVINNFNITADGAEASQVPVKPSKEPEVSHPTQAPTGGILKHDTSKSDGKIARSVSFQKGLKE